MSTDVDHHQAGIALLDANPVLTVHDGALPATVTQVTVPYVLVYTTVEWPDSDPSDANGLDGLSGTCLTTWYCHCVGGNASAATAVAGQVRQSLLDARPTVPGRSCGLIRQDSALPPRRDESLGRVLMDAITVYSLITRPA